MNQNRSFEQFLDDAAHYRVTEEAAIDKAFLAFAGQRGEELYSDVYIRNWKSQNPGEDFPCAYDLLEQCCVPRDAIGEVTFLELICYLHKALPQVTTLARTKASADALNCFDLAFFSLVQLSNNCRFPRR